MFIKFFYELKDAGLPVSPTAFLNLQKALKKGIINSLDDFYLGARTILVKSEGYFDIYDQVFLKYFKDEFSKEGDNGNIARLDKAIPNDLIKKLNSRENLSPGEEFVKNLANEESRLIIVGDASMAPYELNNWNGREPDKGLSPGIERLIFLTKTFLHNAWLNPLSSGTWDYTKTIGQIRRIIPMFELSLEGLEQAVTWLMKK